MSRRDDDALPLDVARPRRRTGRARRGLDAATADLEVDAATLALLRIEADVVDGAAGRLLAYTDARQDPPYSLTSTMPRLLEQYRSALELAGILEPRTPVDDLASLADELERALRDPA